MQLRNLEKEALKRSTSLTEILRIALAVLQRISLGGHEIVQICGPITTGGLGSIEKNMARYNLAITKAREHKLIVFELPAFQEAIGRVVDFENGDPSYRWEILIDLIKGIFESGYISRALFLPGWESSTGSKWEREQLKRLEIPFQDFPAEWLKE